VSLSLRHNLLQGIDSKDKTHTISELEKIVEVSTVSLIPPFYPISPEKQYHAQKVVPRFSGGKGKSPSRRATH
jgi:hypothetical protein